MKASEFKKLIREEVKKSLNEAGKTNTFGFKQTEYDALLQASDRKRYEPTPDKIRTVKKNYPKLKDDEASIVLRLYNSPARNTFTIPDLLNYLKKHYK